MAFQIPTFNLSVNIFSGPFNSHVLRLTVMGNLSLGRRVQQQATDFVFPQPMAPGLQMDLLLPAGTDIRDSFQGFPNDLFEVPAGSGRWYGLLGFDDVGKGFPNEYRLAVIAKIGNVVDGVAYAGLFWPSPVP